jgi:NADH-quinone oxidoreductase subunit G
MFNYIKLQQEKQTTENKVQTISDFTNEKLNIQIKDYYFSNVIARSSKTMIECNDSKLNIKSTGTEG